VEKWNDEQALKKHMETTHFKDFVKKTSSLFVKDLDVVQYFTKE